MRPRSHKSYLAKVNRFSLSKLGFGWLVTFLLLCTFCSVLLSCFYGSLSLSPYSLLQVFQQDLFGGAEQTSVQVFFGEQELELSRERISLLLWDFRFPRALLAFCAGASLAVAGTVYQGVLHNPLADPFTLGVSSGAACGAAIAISFGLIQIFGPYGIAFCAFIGAILALLIVLFISRTSNALSTETMILAGVIVSAFLSAGISLVKALDESSITGIVFWVLGSLQGRAWAELYILAPLLFVSWLALVFFSRELDILSQGTKTAQRLGIHLNFWRVLFLAIASCVSAVCVAMMGIIGFVGLIVPHMCRFLVGERHRYLLIVSGLAGGILLVWADFIAKTLTPGGVELPVGAVTSLLGAPFFCYLLVKKWRNSSNSSLYTPALQASLGKAIDKSLFAKAVVCNVDGNIEQQNYEEEYSPSFQAGRNLEFYDLIAKDLVLQYSGSTEYALDSVSLKIRRGSFIGLLGVNGSGKSSLIHCLSGEEKVNSGSILYKNFPLQHLSHKQRSQSIAVMGQRAENLALLSVFETVLMGRYTYTHFGVSYSEEDKELVFTALKETDTAHLWYRLMPTLSGGEVQRVLLARALVQSTPHLFLDEVLAGLDPASQRIVMQTLIRRNKEENKSILMAIHDLNIAAQYCSDFILLKKGRILAQGSLHDVFTEKNISEAYDVPVRLHWNQQRSHVFVDFWAANFSS